MPLPCRLWGSRPAGRINLIVLLFGDRLARCGPCVRRRGLPLPLRRTGRIRRRAFNAAAYHSRDLASQLIRHFERAEAGNRARRIEVPRILRKPDEIADLWIGGPSATKRRAGQFGGHTRGEKGTDIRIGGGFFLEAEAFFGQTPPRRPRGPPPPQGRGAPPARGLSPPLVPSPFVL